MTSRSSPSARPVWLACLIAIIDTPSRQANADGASRQPAATAPGNGDLMNRYPGTTQNLQHINPRVSADKNLELMQKPQCKKPIFSRHCLPPRTVEKNRELRKKQRELLIRKILPPELPLLAVEAVQPNLPIPAVNQKLEVKARRPKPHDLMTKHHWFPKAVRGAGDPTKFREPGEHGATPARTRPVRPTGRTSISAESYDSSELEEPELTGSRCASSMCDGGMPQLRSCADSWNESESQMRS